jgi:hypothetical protein
LGRIIAAGRSAGRADIDGVERAFSSSRNALVRMALGGNVVVPLVYVPDLHRGLLARVQGEKWELVLQEAARRIRYPAEWYAKLYGIAQGAGTGSGYAGTKSGLRLMGVSADALALLRIEGDFVAIHILSGGEDLAETDSVAIGGYTRYALENGLEADTSLILMSMEAEKDWIPLFEKHGMAPGNEIAISPFPVTFEGISRTAAVTRNDGEFESFSSSSISNGSWVELPGGIVMDGKLHAFYRVGGPMRGIAIDLDRIEIAK